MLAAIIVAIVSWVNELRVSDQGYARSLQARPRREWRRLSGQFSVLGLSCAGIKGTAADRVCSPGNVGDDVVNELINRLSWSM